MFGKTKNPKSDLITHTSEPRTVFPELALRRRSQEHPMVMFATVVAAAFVWTLMPGDTGMTQASASAPSKVIQESTSTAKTSRLPMSDVDRACHGQAWGGESAECLRMIARDNGKADFRVRLIADAGPASPSTPNIF